MFNLVQRSGESKSMLFGSNKTKMFCFILTFTPIHQLRTFLFMETASMKFLFRQKLNFSVKWSNSTIHILRTSNQFTHKNKWKSSTNLTLIRSKDAAECTCINFSTLSILTLSSVDISDGQSLTKFKTRIETKV